MLKLTLIVCNTFNNEFYLDLKPEHIKTLIETLKFCHDYNIVLGDIAPKHIMLCKNNIQLIDLGASYVNDPFSNFVPKNATFGMNHYYYVFLTLRYFTLFAALCI